MSRHAGDYHQLVAAARVPDLSIISTTDPQTLPPSAAACDLVLGEPALVCQVLDRLPALTWVQSTWAGVEPLLDPALSRHYLLTNARGVFGAQMAEYVFGYMLAHERLMFAKWQAQQERRWDPAPPGRLGGKQLGLLGVGSIGADIARTAKHFGMRVRGYTRSSGSCADVDEYFHSSTGSGSRSAIAAFAADLDYLVNVMPNTPSTRHLVDAQFLAALPARAVFINPGRGSAVDEAALAEALTAGRLAGAVLDVFQTEPLPPDHVLWRTPNTIITSHTAALSAPPDIAPIFIQNYRRLVDGQPLKYVVDFEAGY